MKVVVNDTTALTVEDIEGKVLYEWNPFKNKITNLSGFDNSDDSVIGAIHESFNLKSRKGTK